MQEIHNFVQDRSDAKSATLSVLEFNELPFLPQRIYFMQDFVSGTTRGNHAHKKLDQVFVVLVGQVTIEVKRGRKSEVFKMNKGSGQLLLKHGAWRVISNATQDALLMVLASAPYDESDYIRDWDQYIAWHQQTEIGN
jgi:dTDP-4-dehydrorhamnose 3,5-epimerase-like enzyme